MAKNLLLVDDEEMILDVFESLVKAFYRKEVKTEQLKIYKAKNGQEAVKCALEAKPDLVVMDVSMPVMDGIEAFYKMKENNNGEPLKVHFITGFASDGQIGKRMDLAIQDGVLGYFSKPISANDLKNLIDQHLMSV